MGVGVAKIQAIADTKKKPKLTMLVAANKWDKLKQVATHIKEQVVTNHHRANTTNINTVQLQTTTILPTITMAMKDTTVLMGSTYRAIRSSQRNNKRNIKTEN